MDKPDLQKLDSIGTSWVRECLQNGKAFSHLVLSTIDLDRGTAKVAVTTPEHRKAVANRQPLNQGVLTQKEILTNAQAGVLLGELEKISQTMGPITVVVEDNIRSLSDPTPLESDPKKSYLFKDGYLYAMDLVEIQSADDLATYLNVGWLLNGFIVPREVMPNNSKLSQADSESMASSALGVINFAYDGESYTLWLDKSF